MRLKQRAEFLRVGKGRRVHSANLTLQAAARPAGDMVDPVSSARFGLTVTNKTGNSPQRNRIRRRLREVLRLSALPVEQTHDYVVVGRTTLLRLPFEDIGREIGAALKRIHHSRAPAAGRKPGSSRSDITG